MLKIIQYSQAAEASPLHQHVPVAFSLSVGKMACSYESEVMLAKSSTALPAHKHAWIVNSVLIKYSCCFTWYCLKVHNTQHQLHLFACCKGISQTDGKDVCIPLHLSLFQQLGTTLIGRWKPISHMGFIKHKSVLVVQVEMNSHKAGFSSGPKHTCYLRIQHVSGVHNTVFWLKDLIC